MLEPVRLTETVPDNVTPMPVRHDESADPAVITDDPYLLSDGVSLMQPIPVVVVDALSWVDEAGNLRDVQAFNMDNGSVDRTQLADALSDASELSSGDWTVGSWNVLQDAVVAGQSVYDDPAATQQDVDDAAEALVDAMGALVPITALDWTFSASDWTLTPDDDDPRITITGADDTFDDVEYSLNGGVTWVSTGLDAVADGVTLDVALPVTVAIRPVLDGVRGPASPSKTAATPTFTAPPGFSTSTPHEGEPLTLYLGSASGPGTVTIDLYALALAGVDVSGDVSGLSYTPDAAGTLAIRTRATNLWGATLSAIVTAEVTAAPEPPDWDVEVSGSSLIINAMPPMPATPTAPTFSAEDADLIITG